MTSEERDKRLQRREQRTRANMIRVYSGCAEVLRQLFLPKSDPKRHPDADKTWSECSMQVRAALVLAKTQAEHPKADVKELFGIVIMNGRSQNAVEWEKKAAEVEAQQKMKAIDAISMPKAEAK